MTEKGKTYYVHDDFLEKIIENADDKESLLIQLKSQLGMQKFSNASGPKKIYCRNKLCFGR
jgi:hypothetical protein